MARIRNIILREGHYPERDFRLAAGTYVLATCGRGVLDIVCGS